VSDLKKEIKKFSHYWWKLTLQDAFDLHIKLESRVRELEAEKLKLDEHFKESVEMYMETINRLEAERDRLKVDVSLLDLYEELRARHAALVEAATSMGKYIVSKGNLDSTCIPVLKKLKAALAEVAK